MVKECRICHAVKPLEAFYRRSSGRGDGYHSYCKVCHNQVSMRRERERAGDPAHRARRHEQQRAYSQRHRPWRRPGVQERKNAARRQRYQVDPAYRKRVQARQNAYRRRRYASDPDYRARTIAQAQATRARRQAREKGGAS